MIKIQVIANISKISLVGKDGSVSVVLLREETGVLGEKKTTTTFPAW